MVGIKALSYRSERVSVSEAISLITLNVSGLSYNQKPLENANALIGFSAN